MPSVLREKLFKDIDFKNISLDSSFKEDSVRERIVLPIYKRAWA
jgi:hypothetical protein